MANVGYGGFATAVPKVVSSPIAYPPPLLASSEISLLGRGDSQKVTRNELKKMGMP